MFPDGFRVLFSLSNLRADMSILNKSLCARWRRILLLSATFFVLAADLAHALDFPQNPQQWLNSTPLSFKQTAGKTVVLYFFHEQDPECAARWTEMKALAKKYETQPVLFLGINSSGSREEVNAYLKQADLDWPVLLDVNRAFSRECPITELSADNGMQVAILNPDGTVIAGSWEQPEESFQNSLKYSSFKLDPTTIPPTMRTAWRQVEFQQYTAAAPAIKKAMKSSKEELKQGAEALMAYLQPLIDEQISVAEAAYDADEKWPAYRAYLELSEQFKGYELPTNIESRKKELQGDAAVKPELAAMKAYEAARKQAINPATKKKGIAALRKLIKDKPDTDASKKAQELVDELEK